MIEWLNSSSSSIVSTEKISQWIGVADALLAFELGKTSDCEEMRVMKLACEAIVSRTELLTKTRGKCMCMYASLLPSYL